MPSGLEEARKKAPVEAGMAMRRSVPQPSLPSMRTWAPPRRPQPGARGPPLPPDALPAGAAPGGDAWRHDQQRRRGLIRLPVAQPRCELDLKMRPLPGAGRCASAIGYVQAR